MLGLVDVSSNGQDTYTLPTPANTGGITEPPSDLSTGWRPRWTTKKTRDAYNAMYLNHVREVMLANEDHVEEDQVSVIHVCCPAQ
jgi:hypothetical protein